MKKIKYAVEQRLRMIDFLLTQYGHVNRNAIIEYFGIGPAAATIDFRTYQELAPDNIVYNPKERAYYKTASFKQVYK